MAEQDERTPTREQYIDQLIDSFMADALAMEIGFDAWSQKHAPQWHALGRDESWIRQRIDNARSTHNLYQTLKAKGYTPGQRRQIVRHMYEGMPEMYDLMLARTAQTEPPPVVKGTQDVMQRYAVRVMVWEADKQAHNAYCRWADIPETPFHEDEATGQIRDLSTLEELEMALMLCRHIQACCEERPKRTAKHIARSTRQRGEELRGYFIATHGYPPEESTTPRIPVTIDGPIDRDEYWAQLRGETEQSDDGDRDT